MAFGQNVYPTFQASAVCWRGRGPKLSGLPWKRTWSEILWSCVFLRRQTVSDVCSTAPYWWATSVTGEPLNSTATTGFNYWRNRDAVERLSVSSTHKSTNINTEEETLTCTFSPGMMGWISDHTHFWIAVHQCFHRQYIHTHTHLCILVHCMSVDYTHTDRGSYAHSGMLDELSDHTHTHTLCVIIHFHISPQTHTQSVININLWTDLLSSSLTCIGTEACVWKHCIMPRLSLIWQSSLKYITHGPQQRM